MILFVRIMVLAQRPHLFDSRLAREEYGDGRMEFKFEFFGGRWFPALAR
jgi:hypothetical protein